jgi:hypothetical protein
VPTINWEDLFQSGQGLEPEFINRLKQIVTASGGVQSVSAGAGTITVGGTATDPTIAVAVAALKTALALVAADVGLGNVTNDAQLKAADKDVDGTLAANSDTKIPSQKAVKTYADQLLAAAHALEYKGVIDCSANPNYPAAAIGDVYVISVAGKIGGASGTTVDATDLVICTIANAGGTQAAVGADFAVVQANLVGAVTGPTSATDGNLAVFNGATGKIIKDGGAILKRKLLAMWCGTVVPASGTTNGIAEVQKDSDGSVFAFTAARAVARLETVSTSDQTFVIQVAAGGDIAFGTPTTVATITVTAGHFRAEVTGLSQAINSGDLLALLVSAGGAQVPYSVELIATT